MKNIAIFILLISSMYSFGQNSHLALSMGPSFPLGDFAAITDYTTTGYATNGFYLSFDGNYIPTWYFGIGGNLAFGTNAPNQDSMLNGLIDELRDMNVAPIPDDIETIFSIGSWSYINLMVGPTVALPAGKLQFNMKAFIGMSVIIPPNQTLVLKYDNNTIVGYSDTQNASFSYSIGGDIIYELGTSYSVKISAEYFHTSTEYDVEFGLDDTIDLPSITRSITLNSINSTIGLAYLF